MKLIPITFRAIAGMLIVLTFELSYSQQFTEVAVELGVEDSTKLDGIGVHWIDFNGDNLLDLYVVYPGAFLQPYRPVSNRLFMNQLPTTGKFTDVASLVNAGVDTGISKAVGWADFDLNGFIDFFALNAPGILGAPDVPHLLYNNTDGSFTEVGEVKGLRILREGDWSLSFGDPDGDGDLDIYVVNHFWEKNMLLRNDGNVFIDVAEEWGIADHEGGSQTGGIGASWIDFDNDGKLDLFVLNGGWIPNRLYRNDLEVSGRFIDVASEVGIDRPDFFRIAESADWGDFDNDGDLDMFTANFTNDSARSLLYRNDINESGAFVEIGEDVGVGSPGRGVNGAWADYDNDGDLDLYVTYNIQPNRLYRNDLGISGLFVDVAAESNVASDREDRVGAWGDYDNDGDLDLYVTNQRSVIRSSLNLLYRNEQNDLNYLKVRPLSANGSYSRHGSRVYVYKAGTDSLVGMRDAGGGTGFFGSQNQYDAHFGLDGTMAYDIVVRFTTRVNGENIVIDKNVRPELGGLVPIDIGGFIEVRDSVNVIVSVEDEPEAVLPGSTTLYQNYPNPFNAETFISFYLPKSGDLTVTIYNILGEEIAIIHRGYLSAGEQSVKWDASGVSSGIYIYRLKGDNIDISQKMLFLK